MSYEAWGDGDEFFEDHDHLYDAGWDNPETAEAKTALLERCRTVLANMAAEREGFWASFFGRRWPISHEPLRADAKGLLPLLNEVLGSQ